ncbi:MFS transporter [Lichenicoccus sp.]|uniref:MFS transporter n=1 Tax=Lichenicoccus sp. TaxID=2781899 RepID=UPI003D0A917D
MANGSASSLDRSAVHVIAACYLGWTLDAFDFFIMAFVLNQVVRTFGVSVGAGAFAFTLTLACRFIGALVFGRLADRFGRRPTMIANVLCYAALELLTGFATSFTMFLILRGLYGVAMGGEWGVGASLVMESIPARWRGAVSGLLQTGYPMGFLLASLLSIAEPALGWRGMFFVGAAPALLVLYIRRAVPESPDWLARDTAAARVSIFTVLGRNLGLTVFAVCLMMGFNFFSHGSQDLYPSQFLARQHHLPHADVSLIMIIINIGAIVGGLGAGVLSQRIGRRWAIGLLALLALPVIPLWLFSNGMVWIALGGFLIQVCVQGAWGVVPVYLNEISPPAIRATFPGAVYQLGNFLASGNANLQVWLSGPLGSIGAAMALVVGLAGLLIALLVSVGREARDVRMGRELRA